jgi:hypothetical protein
MIRTFAAVAIAVLFLGCSSSNSSAPQVNALGQHPADWSATHFVAFNQNPVSCTPCHGSYTDPTQAGGTSNVSCFGCHHPNGPMHPVATGWDTPAQHGATAKQAASLTGGFALCASCHDSGYNDVDGKTESCMTCHTNAPHPDKPWHGTTASGTNHATTDPSNAAECAKCHLNAANLDPADLPIPAVQAPAGTAPGCFNNTMCHGDNPGHVANWTLPGEHGLLGAMAAPSATSGMAYCATCHGSESTFTGGAGPSCFVCHTTAPHPPDTDSNWVNATTPVHAGTNQGNLPVCIQCHANGSNSTLKPSPAAVNGTAPGCFNGTLCHSANGI